jgi:hypothetical protein
MIQGRQKQQSRMMPQRFDSRLMIWQQQRNESGVRSPPKTLVHETHLQHARAPLSASIAGGEHGRRLLASLLLLLPTRRRHWSVAKKAAESAVRGGVPWPSSTATFGRSGAARGGVNQSCA